MKLRVNVDPVNRPLSVETDGVLTLRDAPQFEGTLKLAAAEGRRFRILLNRAPAAGRLRAAIEAEIERQALPALAATLGNRTGFAAAFAQGLGVSETAPKSLAARELAALLAEMQEVLA